MVVNIGETASSVACLIWANNFSYLSFLSPPCLRLFLLFLIAEKVSKKASRQTKQKTLYAKDIF